MNREQRRSPDYLRKVDASSAHEQCRDAIIRAMEPFAEKIGPVGMLAVASTVVGQLIAMQDQRTMTPEMAMNLVCKNMEEANKAVVDGLRNTTAGQA